MRTDLLREDTRDERWLGSPVVAVTVGLGYLMLGVLVFWHWWASGHLGSTAASGTGDPALEIWDMRWMPYALAHGQNPFLTNRLLFPSGVNLIENASFLLPAFILSPVTVLFGPVVSYGVAGTLAPALSGWTAYLMIRRFTSWYPAAILGGLFFGFSPFLLGNLPYSHLNVTWLFFLPLMVVALYELWVVQKRGPVRYGIYLGLLLAGQFFVGVEILLLTGVLAGLTVVYLLATGRLRTRGRLRHALVGTSWALGVCVAVVSYPLYLGLAGPAHFTGSPWSSTTIGVGLGELVRSSPVAHLGTTFTQAIGYFGPVGPNWNYLGIPLATLLVVGVALWWRDGLLRWAAVMFAVCAVLAVGIPAEPKGTVAPWTPWRLVAHVPLLRQTSALHFAGMGTLFVALALGLVLNHLWSTSSDHLRTFQGGRHGPSVTRLALVGIIGIGAGCLVPVYQSMSLPFVMKTISTPAWFSQTAKTVPVDTTLLVLPYPSTSFTNAMAWQAMDGLRFRLVGGDQLVPGRDGQIDHDPPGPAGHLLSDLTAPATSLPAVSSRNIELVRSFIRTHHVDDVVATTFGAAPRYAVGFFTAVLGRAPHQEGGVAVWYHATKATPPLHNAQSRLDRCSSTMRFHSVPRCVLAR